MSRRGEASPRVRVVLVVALAVTASLLTVWQLLLPLAGAGLLLAAAAGVPLRTLLRRLAWLAYLAVGLFVTLPLAVPGPAAVQLQAGRLSLAVSQTGLAMAGLVCLRMLGAFLPVLALAAVTPAEELLQALADLGVPRLFVVLAGMAIRYIAVLRDEARRQLLGRRSRGYRPAGSLWHRQTLRSSAQLMGMLLLRAYDRSERIYWAMMSRGYRLQNGAAPAAPLSGAERWTVAAAVLAIGGLVLLDRRIRGG